MNKSTLKLLFLLIIYTPKSYSQLYDNHILIGDYYKSSGLSPFFVKTVNSQTVFELQKQIKIPLYFAKTSASDSLGNLIFYTDGLDIYGKNYQLLQNGANLNPGTWRNYYVGSDFNYESVFSPQFIPFPGHPNEYILFHVGVAFDSLLTEWHNSPLYFTRINMENNSGLGGATEKNEILLDKLHLANFALCKHGNGRDWWLVIRENNDERYFKFLIDPEGIHGPYIQLIQTSLNRGNGTLDIFTQDGKYYIESNDYLIRVYYFNRCNGELSLKTEVILPIQQFFDFPKVVQAPLGSGYLYFAWFDKLLQIPLNSTNKLEYAKFLAPINISNDGILEAKIGFSFLTPNNEFYIISANGTNIIHTINKAELPGLNCDFEEDALRLSAKVWGITPVYPNYRLTKAIGSECDSLFFHGSKNGINKNDSDLIHSRNDKKFSSINKSLKIKQRTELMGNENYIKYMKEKNKDIKTIETLINEIRNECRMLYQLNSEKR